MTLIQLAWSLCMTGISGYVLGCEIRNLVRAFASRWWTVGVAEIVRASIEESSGRHRGKRVTPIVEYRYEYDGREYVCDRLVFGILPDCSDKEAERLLARLEPGTRWLVNIHPERPQLAVLQPGPHRHNWFAICFLIIFTGASAVFLVDSAREAATACGYMSTLPAHPDLEKAALR